MLTYNIALEHLSGTIGTRSINVRAASGGGRGSTVHPSGAPGHIGMHAWNTQRQAAGAVRGGPIPPGFYIVHKPEQHAHLGRAAFLEQTLTSLIFSDPSRAAGIGVTRRGGFFMHGRGNLGSDGCIVPMSEFKEIMDLLAEHAPLALRVVNPGVLMDRLAPIPGNLV